MPELKWFILIENKQWGPYTLKELKGIKEITPDTLCRQEGTKKWIPIRKVAELKKLFKDENEIQSKELSSSLESPEDLTLTLPHAEPPIYYWYILLALLIIYAFFQIYS